MADGVKQQQRRGTAAEWNVSNHVLDDGELGVTTDTGVIKIGDGINGWNDLPIAFGSDYLPILGKAADSELLDGISSSGFFKTADATTAATADKLALRNADGRLKAANGASTDDVVNYAQMIASVASAKQLVVSRTVSADFTLQVADAGSMIFVNGANWHTTIVCTLPTHATVAIPVGSIVEVRTASSSRSPVSFVPAGGVSLVGASLIYGAGSSIRLYKNGNDSWVTLSVSNSPGPVLHRKIKAGSDNTLTLTGFTKLRLDGANGPVTEYWSNNVDTLGATEQYSSATDLYKVYCRRAGYYSVNAHATVEQSAAGRMYLQFRVNGNVQKLGGGNVRNQGPHMTTNVGFTIPLNVNEYMEIELYVEGGTAPTYIADEPYASSFFNWTWERPL